MAKCSECGLLAVWLRLQARFDEASEYFRKNGRPEAVQDDEGVFHAKCFIRKHDLVSDLRNGKSPAARVFSYGSTIREVIDTERKCDGYVPWIQGFHPKEQREMLLNQEMLEIQRRHATHNLWAVVATAIFTGLSVAVGAFITNHSADLGAKATIKAAEMQIEAQKEIAKQAQPMNITVNIPEVKKPVGGTGKK